LTQQDQVQKNQQKIPSQKDSIENNLARKSYKVDYRAPTHFLSSSPHFLVPRWQAETRKNSNREREDTLGCDHFGVFNQNKILFARIGRFWLPWLPEFSSSISNALFNHIQDVH